MSIPVTLSVYPAVNPEVLKMKKHRVHYAWFAGRGDYWEK
jgi:hypothetical protein